MKAFNQRLKVRLVNQFFSIGFPDDAVLIERNSEDEVTFSGFAKDTCTMLQDLARPRNHPT